MPSELPSEVTFLVDEDLSNAIRRVVMGDDVRCAVAYWGDHHFVDDEMPVREWQIICDIHSGNTSPEVLKGLGAPKNNNLRFFKNLHTKVYMSGHGVIIGSANASAGGLHYNEDPARLLEAGVFHPTTSCVFEDCSKWFSKLFKSATQVDKIALLATGRRFRATLRRPNNLGYKKLLGLILENRQWMIENRVTVVVSDSSTTKSDLEEAIKANPDNVGIVELGGADGITREWNPGECFAKWGDDGISALGDICIDFYCPLSDKPHVSVLRVDHRFPRNDFALARKDPETMSLIARLVGPTRKTVNKNDVEWELLRDVIKKNEADFYDSEENFGAVLTIPEFCEMLKPFWSQFD